MITGYGDKAGHFALKTKKTQYSLFAAKGSGGIQIVKAAKQAQSYFFPRSHLYCYPLFSDVFHFFVKINFISYHNYIFRAYSGYLHVMI